MIKAVETTDECLGRVVDAVSAAGGVCLITADHGNAEQLLAADGVSPHTAHTTNPVPSWSRILRRAFGRVESLRTSRLRFLPFWASNRPKNLQVNPLFRSYTPASGVLDPA